MGRAGAGPQGYNVDMACHQPLDVVERSSVERVELRIFESYLLLTFMVFF